MDRKPISFGLLSDTHLGYRQYGLKSRERDFENAFMDSIMKMHMDELKYGLIPGDILNARNPNSRTISFLKACNKWLIDHEITVFVIDGNHDFCVPSWMHVCRNEGDNSPYGFQSVADKRVEIEGYTISGVPFFNQFPKALLDEPGDILLLHTPVTEFVQYPGEGIPTVEDLPTDKYSFIAVGDTHIDEIITLENSLVISPGSTEMNSTSEPIEKFWYRVDFDGSKNPPKVTPNRIETRPIIKLDITNEEQLVQAIQLLKDEETSEPMVIGQYLNIIPDALSRMKAAVDLSKVILRVEPVGANVEEVKSANNVTTIRPISDYVQDFLSPDDETFDLAVALAKSDDGNKLIDSWLDKREEVLKNA